MSVETKKVLEMLAEGKITADEADKLLEKLTAAGAERTAPEDKPEEKAAPATKMRFLRIQVEKPGQENVNIRMPLGFLGKGRRLLAVLPLQVGEKLAEHGVDLSAFAELNDEDFAEAIRSTNIDIDKGNGKKVRIFCE
jgi:hypothetical protein